MTSNSETSQVFSGLILLTGEDKAGISKALFETLTPFAVSVIDIDQIIIKQRLILTVQIQLNPSHQEAIEADLNALAEDLQVDIASLFSGSEAPVDVPNPVIIKISSSKMLPSYLHSITSAIHAANGNIEKFDRISAQPLSLNIHVSGVSKQVMANAIAQLEPEIQSIVSLA
jgi:phosphoserine phosphatase